MVSRRKKEEGRRKNAYIESFNSSGNGSSKSSLVQIAPACNPALRCLVGDAIGAKRTRGMPPSVRTTSMPLSARDNNSFKFVCASCTTVFVSIAVIQARD